MNSPNSTLSLAERFPHLKKEIWMLALQDSGFSQLSEDYLLLVGLLESGQLDADADKEELIYLKTALEAEALEKLSQVKLK